MTRPQRWCLTLSGVTVSCLILARATSTYAPTSGATDQELATALIACFVSAAVVFLPLHLRYWTRWMWLKAPTATEAATFVALTYAFWTTKLVWVGDGGSWNFMLVALSAMVLGLVAYKMAKRIELPQGPSGFSGAVVPARPLSPLWPLVERLPVPCPV